MTQTQAPPARPTGPTGPPGPQPPAGRDAGWRRRLGRARAAAGTEPGRLRLIGTALAVLLVAFGSVTAWQVSSRADAADAVVDRSQPLTADAARIYRSLADANTAASSGFLAGGDEPRAVRDRYERNIRRAAELVAGASATTERAQQQITVLNRELPVYTGLVESARANNRQGLPLGGAYLRYADERMDTRILPAAQKLYEEETARLAADSDDARSWPLPAVGLGVLTLAALGWAQRRHYDRTNRVFSPGLVAATAAALVALLWLAAGHGLARSGLGEADETGTRSLAALNEAWVELLQARGAENMWLVARGGGSAYEEEYTQRMKEASGPPSGDRFPDARAGLLGDAGRIADDTEGSAPVAAAQKAVDEWRTLHGAALQKEKEGDYDAALDTVIRPGGGASSVESRFAAADSSLERAAKHEQAEFEEAAGQGRGAFTGLAAGAAALGVLGAVAAVSGVNRRLAEYR